MAVCPFAVRRLLPESQTQSHITPTQVIDHTIVGSVSGTDSYFRDHTNVETHFGIRYSGEIWQWMDTAVRADGNYHANMRPDGTGAVSIETEGYASEPWTEAQVDALVQLHVWLALTHDGIGHRICRNPSDPGYGYHVMFGAPGEWTPVSKDCPGTKRIKQWREQVIPRTLAALRGEQEDIVASLDDLRKVVREELDKERPEVAEEVKTRVWSTDLAIPGTRDPQTGKSQTQDASVRLTYANFVGYQVRTLVQGLVKQVGDLAKLVAEEGMSPAERKALADDILAGVDRLLEHAGDPTPPSPGN